MGGKIWLILILLALVGMVQAATPCNGSISCGTTAISCPSYCNTPYSRCAYPSGNATCNNYCDNATWQCSTCIPSCGTPTCTNCSPTTMTCPVAYCSGTNQQCTYPATASCSNTCSGTDVVGICSNCTPTCTVTCTPCGAGVVCQAGKCVAGGGPGSRGRETPLEETPAMPVGDTWNFAVVILAIIGLCLGYFIMKEALSVSVTRPAKKRKRR